MAPKCFFLLCYYNCMTHQRRQGNRFSSFPLSLLYLYLIPSSHPFCFSIAFICSSHRQSPPPFLLTYFSFILTHLFHPNSSDLQSSSYLYLLISFLQHSFPNSLIVYPIVVPLPIFQPWRIGVFSRGRNELAILYIQTIKLAFWS
jgi:hypothetical protein